MSELRFEDVTVRFGSGRAADDRRRRREPHGARRRGPRARRRVRVGQVHARPGGGRPRACAGAGASCSTASPIDVRHGRRPLQMVFQDPYSSLDPRMTIGASIAEILPRGLKRARSAATRSRACSSSCTSTPSRARRTRRSSPAVSASASRIARALAGRPEVLIADEITSALDVSIQGVDAQPRARAAGRARPLDALHLAQPRRRPLRRHHASRSCTAGASSRRARPPTCSPTPSDRTPENSWPPSPAGSPTASRHLKERTCDPQTAHRRPARAHRSRASRPSRPTAPASPTCSAAIDVDADSARPARSGWRAGGRGPPPDAGHLRLGARLLARRRDARVPARRPALDPPARGRRGRAAHPPADRAPARRCGAPTATRIAFSAPVDARRGRGRVRRRPREARPAAPSSPTASATRPTAAASSAACACSCTCSTSRPATSASSPTPTRTRRARRGRPTATRIAFTSPSPPASTTSPSARPCTCSTSPTRPRRRRSSRSPTASRRRWPTRPTAPASSSSAGQGDPDGHRPPLPRRPRPPARRPSSRHPSIATSCPARPATPARCRRSRPSGDVLFAIRDRGCTHLYAVPLDGRRAPARARRRRAMSSAGLSVAGDVAAIALVDADLVRRDRAHRPRLRRRDRSSTRARRGARRRRAVRARVARVHDQRRRDGAGLAAARPRGHRARRPLLVDVHGGPHNAWNGAVDDMHLYHQELVARGWTVLMLNPRGSDGYGEEFFTAVNGKWGEVDAKDFLEPIDAARRRGSRRPAAPRPHRLQLRRLHDLLPHEPRRPLRRRRRGRRGERPHEHGRHERRRAPAQRVRDRRDAVEARRPRAPRRDVAVLAGRQGHDADARAARRRRRALPRRAGRAVALRAARARHPDPSRALPRRQPPLPARWARPATASTTTRASSSGCEQYAGDAAGPRPAAIDAAHWQRRLERAREAAQGARARSSASCGWATARDDEVVTAAHGTLNKNIATGAPVTKDSIFQIGSISKVWTATRRHAARRRGQAVARHQGQGHPPRADASSTTSSPTASRSGTCSPTRAASTATSSPTPAAATTASRSTSTCSRRPARTTRSVRPGRTATRGTRCSVA